MLLACPPRHCLNGALGSVMRPLGLWVGRRELLLAAGAEGGGLPGSILKEREVGSTNLFLITFKDF